MNIHRRPDTTLGTSKITLELKLDNGWIYLDNKIVAKVYWTKDGVIEGLHFALPKEISTHTCDSVILEACKRL